MQGSIGVAAGVFAGDKERGCFVATAGHASLQCCALCG